MTDWGTEKKSAKINFWVWLIVSIVSLTLAASVWEYGLRCLSAPFLFVWLFSVVLSIGSVYSLQAMSEKEEDEKEALRRMGSNVKNISGKMREL